MGTNKAFWRVEKIMNWESTLKAGPKCLMCEDEEGNSIPMEKVYSKQVGNKWRVRYKCPLCDRTEVF